MELLSSFQAPTFIEMFNNDVIIQTPTVGKESNSLREKAIVKYL